MNREILETVDTINNCTGKITGYVILTTMGACVIEVIARYIFNKPTIWAYEFETLSCAIVYIMVGGYVLLHKGHVRIEVVYDRLSPKVRSFIDIAISYPLLLFMSAIYTYVGVIFAIDSIKITEHSYTSWGPPLWPVKLFLPVGCFLLFIQVLVGYLRLLSGTKEEKK